MRGQHAAHVIGHRAQILADHHAVRAGRLDGQHGDHRLVVVRHVGAALRALAPRDPPQAEQAEHMVDAHRAGVREHRMHHLAVHPVAGPFQIARVERRLAPVLPLLVVEVRRAADRHAADGEALGAPPHVGAQCVHADGHVLHQAQRHAGVLRGPLRRGHLLVGDPLQPAVELEQIMMVAHQTGDLGRRAIGAAEPRVRLPRRAPHLEGQAPCGERVEIRAGLLLEPRERGLALGGTRVVEDDAQRLALGGPGLIDVQRIRIVVAGGHGGVQRGDAAAVAVAQLAVFGDVLGADVRDVEEPAGLGQIGGGLERWDRRAGVDRVDQHEVGAGFGGRIDQQPPEVAIVADAPRILGPDGIHLRHPAPARMLLDGFGQRDAPGGDHQRGGGYS